MVTSTICLPELLDDGDAKCWFQRFNVCTTANKWDAADIRDLELRFHLMNALLEKELLYN